MRNYRGLAVLAAAMLLTLDACGAGASNPLLGKWRAEPNGYVTRDGVALCEVDPEIEFTATQQTLYQAATPFRPAAQGTTPVVYQVSGKTVMVSVSGGAGSQTAYILLGPDEMQATDMGNCRYKRE